MFDAVTYGAAVGAAKRYTDEHSGGSSDAVKYTEQTLTSAQQAQARTNIGAAAAAIDYSTTEQDTGIKWVDGKPIYQITYAFDPPVTGSNVYIDLVDVSGLSIDTLIYMSGIERDLTYGNFAVLETHTSNEENLFLTADKSTVKYMSRLSMDFLTLRYTRAIIIIKQPEDVTVEAGKKFTMSVEAIGESLTYLWQYMTPTGTEWKNFSSGATSNTLSKVPPSNWDGWRIHCIVTDANNRVATSDIATLTVVESSESKSATSATGDGEKQGEPIDDESKTLKNINGTFTWVDDM